MRHWLPVPTKSKSYELVKLDRDILGKCMQFITGHARMNRHENLVYSAARDADRQVIPTCRLCGHEEETPLHLVTEYDEIIWDARNILGGQDIHPDPYDPWIVFKWGVQISSNSSPCPNSSPYWGEKRTPRMTTSSWRTMLLMMKQIMRVISPMMMT